jgi:hypothetical protein
MAQDNTLARSLHDLGLATWFGGSLMGAVGLNGAAAVVDQPAQRLRVANAGWARWTPVNLAGIAAHVAGGAVLLAGNKGRLASQRGVAGATIAKATVTGLALGATAYSRALGERLMQAGDAPVEGGTTPTDDTPPELAAVQRQLTVLQWVIPGLTGTALVLNALMGEQQRPQQVTSGLLQGLRSRLPVLALAGTGLLCGRAAGARPPVEAGNDHGPRCHRLPSGRPLPAVPVAGGRWHGSGLAGGRRGPGPAGGGQAAPRRIRPGPQLRQALAGRGPLCRRADPSRDRHRL